MKPENLLRLLKQWLQYESCIDRDGTILPSKSAIDVAHYHFIVSTRLTRHIESVKIDGQGGILINLHAAHPEYKFVLHVLFDGVIDYYQIYNDGLVEKQRLFLQHKNHGFGTDSYRF